MDHLKADVFINDELQTDTPHFWCLSDLTEFDDRIPVPEWPPPGSAYAGAALGKDDLGREVSRVELYVAGSLYSAVTPRELRSRYPSLKEGDQILFVDGELASVRRRGALRLRVAGKDGRIYRNTNFTPVQSMEEEAASKFARTLWFEREESR
jgi:hypothetical protein